MFSVIKPTAFYKKRNRWYAFR